MDDLDALLEDLGRPKSTLQKKPRAPSSRVDLNELEDLMQDLAAPSARAPPAAAPVQSYNAPPPQQPQYGASRPVTASSDDLDALMASLNSMPAGGRETVSVQQPVPTYEEEPQQYNPAPEYDNVIQEQYSAPPPQQSYNAPPPQQSYNSAPSQRNSTIGGMDDLDNLLNGLNAEPSRASTNFGNNRASVQQPRASVTAAPPRVAQPVNGGGYGAPQNNNFAPQNNYGAQNGYGAPQNNYSAPQNNYGAQNSYGGAAQNNRVGGGPPKTPLQGDDLDNLLTNLTSQMTDIDSNTPAARGTCYSCRKPILGEVIQALGKTFHPEHFVCGNCQNPLGTASFYEQDGVPHCEKCYQDLFCSRCAHCDESILDRCITALGKKWHIHHFVCAQCGQNFNNGSFFEKDGRPYCENDFYNAFAPRCAGCNQGIKGECINALGTTWHPEHFVCQHCKKGFNGGTFYALDNKPYCADHYHANTGSVCGGCGKAIVGKCVNALDKKWHPEHFVCAFCMNPLAGNAFTENNGKAYCRDCNSKLFGM
eukprot:TRINITY_DN8958_c0_g1_i1.p1 TRINITY_DN8958_c0_g1~~TRINITY_DN8958_c0_g1_i1.p1  ORF type:complete len:535 (-),score=106.74 TRINITY_DN8958_c0_g1_i1:102-1706(-)